MNKLFFYLVLSIIFLISNSTYGQDPMVKLYETNGSGNKKKEIPFEQTGIVDINSSISLELQIDKIESELLAFHGISRDDKRLKELETLNKILSLEVGITNYINVGFKGKDFEAQLTYFRGLDRLTNELLDSIEVDSELNDELRDLKTDQASNKFERAGKGTYLQFILYFLNEKADKIRKELISSLGLSGKDSAFQVFFRLGAFLRDKNGGRPIHVENFDDYDKENYQEIGRFGKPISNKEQKALQENARLNNELGGEIKQSIENFKGIVRSYQKELHSFKDTFSELDSFYKSNIKKLKSTPETLPVAKVFEENPPGLNQVDVLYTTLFEQYDEFASLFSPEMTNREKIKGTLKQIGEIIEKGVEQFDKDIEKYTLNSEATASGIEVLGKASDQYKTYLSAIKKDINSISSFIQELRNPFRPFRKAFLENEEFSNKVNRFKLGNIPSSGYIELNYIGTVRPGDEILIKATLERGVDRKSAKFEEKQIYRKVVKIQRISPYIKMSGSIIMANPYTRDDIPEIDLENTFQFAPTYGIIMKWGSRKSSFYNKFIDLGVGLAFSSPDFNTDGTPEFGAGIMLTAFKDIFSVGWGRNFGLDAPYTFIGFNIPFSIGGLPSDNSGRFNN